MPSLHMPTWTGMIELCERQELAIGVLLMGLGVVFMIMGLRLFKALICLSFAAGGLALGLQVPVSDTLQWVCGGVAAVVLGIASSYVMKLAVAILAGGWAGFLAAALISHLDVGEFVPLSVGGAVLLAVASLTLTLYHQVISFVTSLEGSMLFLGGLIAVLARAVPGVWGELRSMLLTNAIFGPFLVVAGTVMGFYFQWAESRQQESGMSG
jgi:hypothetical protein